jgi:hypothetical protein
MSGNLFTGADAAGVALERAEALLAQNENGIDALVSAPIPNEEPLDSDRENGDASHSEPRSSVATQLVAMARDRYRFMADETGEARAILLGGPAIARRLRGRQSVRAELAATYFAATGRAAPSAALTDAIATLEGQALSAPRERLALRVAEHGAGIYLDMGRPDGTNVVISQEGWYLTDTAPITWRRTELTGELPEPVTGGNIEDLQGLIHLDTANLHLAIGWMLSVFWPTMPHPVLVVGGEQGAGKTAAARVMVSLLDPGPAPMRTAPRDIESWVVSAAGSMIVALDNVSGFSPWLSDALCRAVTGDGLVRRALYTDGDLAVTSFRRAVIVTSIDAGALRGDLAERCLTLELEPIPENIRRTDAEIERAITVAAPQILGGLLDLASKVLAALPGVRPDRLPRMADFGRLLAALDAVTGWTTLADFRRVGSNLLADAAADDPVGTAILSLVEPGTTWEGTTSELLTDLGEPTNRDWPTTPRGLTGQLARLGGPLRAVGVNLSYGPKSRHGRLIRLQRDLVDSQMETVHNRHDRHDPHAGSGSKHGRDGRDSRSRSASRDRVPPPTDEDLARWDAEPYDDTLEQRALSLLLAAFPGSEVVS